jgi:cytochrome c6
MKKFLFFLFLGIWIYACSKNERSEKESATTEGLGIYKKYCLSCHGVDGRLGLNGSKDLTISKLTEAERIIQVTEGKNTMTPFKGILSPEEIKAVAAYTLTLK